MVGGRRDFPSFENLESLMPNVMRARSRWYIIPAYICRQNHPDSKNMRLLTLAPIVLAVFLLSAGFQCLVECDEVFCSAPLRVRFLSKADGSDLFANGTYNADNLQVFSMWADSTMAVQEFYAWPLTQDSKERFIYFELYEIAGPIVAYVFQFDNQTQDTLQVRYFKEDTDCCDEKPNFTFGIYRGDTVRAERNGYFNLKK